MSIKRIDPKLYVIIAAAICIIMFAGGYYVEVDTDYSRETVLELLEHSEKIQYYDEVLTMSARLAAFTGDMKWEERYRAHEKKLDESLKIIIETMPLNSGLQASKELESANVALLNMEAEAFDLVRQGKKQEAVAVLFSDSYLQQKEIYARGQSALHESAADFIENAEYKHDNVDLPILAGVGILGLLFIAFSVYTGLRTQEKLHEQEKLALEYRRLASVGKFSAGIAHEINNSLQPLMGLSEILAKGLAKEQHIDQRFTEYAHIIYSSSRHAREVVENVLVVARGSNSQLAKWDALSLMEDVVDYSAKILPETIELQRDFLLLEGEKKYVLVNKTDVTRIVVNIFKNAQQAMQDHGTLTVKASVQTMAREMAAVHDMDSVPCLVLLIKDTGAGMDKKTLASIFSPFFTAREGGQGIGLGLSMAYGIMRQYSGTITVESRPGFGSSFFLYFPLVK